MKRIFIILALIASPAWAQSYEELSNRQDVMQQQYNQMQRDQEEARQAQALHEQFNQPPPQYAPQVQYYPAYGDGTRPTQ